jgi:hypothetical protein
MYNATNGNGLNGSGSYGPTGDGSYGPTGSGSYGPGRKRGNLQGVNPLLTTKVISLVEKLSSALEKYNEKSN